MISEADQPLESPLRYLSGYNGGSGGSSGSGGIGVGGIVGIVIAILLFLVAVFFLVRWKLKKKKKDPKTPKKREFGENSSRRHNPIYENWVEPTSTKNSPSSASRWMDVGKSTPDKHTKQKSEVSKFGKSTADKHTKQKSEVSKFGMSPNKCTEQKPEVSKSKLVKCKPVPGKTNQKLNPAYETWVDVPPKNKGKQARGFNGRRSTPWAVE